jgi:16S rRNA (adenine1518-N6/adenine1519-N6)-dimethyltransferase
LAGYIKVNLRAKKSLGQNFLVDQRIAARIVSHVAPTPSQLIIEVGPGQGALTSLLLPHAGALLAVELDDRLIPTLQQRFTVENFRLVAADILQLNILAEVNACWAAFPALSPPARVVANLPYYISTAVIRQFLAAQPVIGDLTLMLQREVAQRIVTPPGSRDYGVLSVLVQAYSHPKILFHVPPGAFRPIPQVESSVIHLTLHPQPLVPNDLRDAFATVVTAAFAQRRKTILNSLRSVFDRFLTLQAIGQALELAQISPQTRAETLSPMAFLTLTKYLFRDGNVINNV